MADPHPPVVEPAFSFDRFLVVPHQRLLLEAGRRVRIGSRAFDLLLALLERPGERIGKAELLARVWPGTNVVEGNLKFQVAALRRVIRDGQDGRRFVETSQGQGYCFVAPVTVVAENDPAATVAVGTQRHNLPEQLTTLVGRDDVVARIAQLLVTRRLVTVVGPGGIGKTSVALAVAERLLDTFEDGVWVVELSQIADAAALLGAVARVVGIPVGPASGTQDLIGALRGRRMLLVLDTCSHVVDAAASLVVAILRGAPHVRILATSREPLRTEGEHVVRLGPLDVPPASAQLEAEKALRYPAVRLFAEQAAAYLDGLDLSDDDASRIAEICRKLDGIPLAIELAAARVGVLGIGGVAAQLDDRLRLLTGGRRTALPRHRTLRAALDWSHDLLGPAERTVFRRLAVFVGGFTLDAASGVAADSSHPADEVAELVLELAAKSLVVADLDARDARFRLLDTTRSYALEKLREADELGEFARRHATYVLGIRGAASCAGADGEDQDAAAAAELGNLRAALTWAFGPGGDPAIGVGLAAASLPVWLALSLMGEAHAWIEAAVEALDAARLRGSHQEMVLQAGRGISLQIVRARSREARAALDRALELAERLGDAGCQLHVLHTLWVHHVRTGEVRTALDLARRAEAVAASAADPDAQATAEWMLGIARHFAGEYGAARLHLEHVLRGQPPGSRARWIRRAGFDPHTAARYVLAHCLWVQGHPDQAAEAVGRSVEEARRMGHPVSLCSVLALGACPLALNSGDLDVARQSAAELVGHAEQHALGDHLSYGKAVLAIVALRQAGPEATAEHARAALECWRAAQWHVLLGVIGFAEAAAAAGLAEEMSALVEEAIERAERDQDLWAYPEMLRIKGELLLLRDAPDARVARGWFVRSLELARAHGARAWELRAAASLHRLDLRLGKADDSREALSRICRRFGEGLDSADLRMGRELLADDGRRGPP